MWVKGSGEEKSALDKCDASPGMQIKRHAASHGKTVAIFFLEFPDDEQGSAPSSKRVGRGWGAELGRGRLGLSPPHPL